MKTFFDSDSSFVIGIGYNSNRRNNYSSLIGFRPLCLNPFIDPYKGLVILPYKTKFNGRNYNYTLNVLNTKCIGQTFNCMN